MSVHSCMTYPCPVCHPDKAAAIRRDPVSGLDSAEVLRVARLSERLGRAEADRDQLVTERDVLRAEVERLTRERDGWRDERTRTASGLPLYVPVLTAPDETGARDVDHFRLATSEDIEALAEVERLRARWDALTSAPAVEAGAEAMLEVPLEDDDWGVVANAAIRAAMQAAQTTTKED